MNATASSTKGLSGNNSLRQGYPRARQERVVPLAVEGIALEVKGLHVRVS